MDGTKMTNGEEETASPAARHPKRISGAPPDRQGRLGYRQAGTPDLLGKMVGQASVPVGKESSVT